MGKVAIYCRVSTVDRQDYMRQISDCKTSIGSKYTDNDIEVFGDKVSGYSKNDTRPELSKLLNLISSDLKYFDAIYMTELSRLGRDPKSTRNLIDDLTEKRIPIFITSINKSTLDEHGERDSTMNIILQVLMEFADSESRTMKRRTRSGLLESAKVKGNAGGSKYYPYGYRKDFDKKLIIDDEEAEIVKEIFDWYKSGNGFKKIAGFLNDKKVPTRVNKFGNQLMKFNTHKTADQVIWSDKTVNDIVNNPIYKGMRRYKSDKLADDDTTYDGHVTKVRGERFKTIYINSPVIISPELFDDCQAIIKSKTHRNSVITYPYILKDLLTCGVCGKNMFAKYKPTRGDKVYMCSSRLTKGGNCGNVGVNITYLDSVIFDALIAHKLLHDKIEQSDKMLPSVQSTIENLTKQLSFENSELVKHQKRMEKWAILFTDTDMTMETYKATADKNKKILSNLKSKISLITKDLKEQNEILTKISNKTREIDFLQNLSDARPEIKVILQQFVKNIYITKMPIAGDILLDVHLKISNNKPGATLKLMIDQFATRFKTKTQYTYRMKGIELITNYNDKGILTTTQEEIYTPFSTRNGKEIFVVPKENVLIL